jgi:ABC-type branched-subunit amino acid transport system ATPase component
MDLSLERISHAYGDTEVLRDISLEVKSEERGGPAFSTILQPC